jgi:hypothetical protein
MLVAPATPRQLHFEGDQVTTLCAKAWVKAFVRQVKVYNWTHKSSGPVVVVQARCGAVHSITEC